MSSSVVFLRCFFDFPSDDSSKNWASLCLLFFFRVLLVLRVLWQNYKNNKILLFIKLEYLVKITPFVGALLDVHHWLLRLKNIHSFSSPCQFLLSLWICPFLLFDLFLFNQKSSLLEVWIWSDNLAQNLHSFWKQKNKKQLYLYFWCVFPPSPRRYIPDQILLSQLIFRCSLLKIHDLQSNGKGLLLKIEFLKKWKY